MAGRLFVGLQGWRALIVGVGVAFALVSSIFAGAIFVAAMGADEIEVRVFVDSVGDQLLDGVVGDANNPVAAGVEVRIWSDDGTDVGLADAGDTFVGQFTTDATGEILAGGLSVGQQYWVGVDAATVLPPSGTTGVGVPLAEQTYGPAGSVSDAVGTLTGSAGPLYGGRDPVLSDVPATLIEADHLALMSPGDPVGEFGFSFNVVTNTEPTQVQGSIYQFVANANGENGPNAMRFVPAVATNATGAGANWWRVNGTTDLVVSDALTAIDGTVFDPAGNVTDSNPGKLSANAGATVGTRGATLTGVDRPELQLDGRIIFEGASGLTPFQSEVRDVHVGSGVGSPSVEVNGISGGTIPEIVVSGVVTGTVDPTSIAGSAVTRFAAVSIDWSPASRIENSFLGPVTDNLIIVNESPAVTLTNTELAGAGLDGFNANPGSEGMVVTGNLLSAVDDYCIDSFQDGLTVSDNTFANCGDGAGQSGGIRVGDGNATIRFNRFENNDGPGIIVAGENNSMGRDRGLALISQNEFLGNTGISIDLADATNDNLANGDGITENNGALNVSSGNLSQEYPVITDVVDAGGGTVDVIGTACGSCVVEIYRSESGAGDTNPATLVAHGEGAEFLGSGPVDGSAVFSINIPATGLTQITATATGSGLTSEFAPNYPLRNLSGRVLLDPNSDADLSDGTPLAGVTVRVYRDVATSGGLEVPTGADTLEATLTTDATGRWSYPDALSGFYWVSVDSRTIAPATLNGGSLATDAWAEQTAGPAGSLRTTPTGTEATTVDGPVMGGRSIQSDFPADPTTAEHILRIDADSPRIDLDTGFSFNLVTEYDGGGLADLAPGEGRTEQGSVRQFIQNANAIAGPNQMRFIPTSSPNSSGGPHQWWTLFVFNSLPAIVDADTVIDGQAFRYDLPAATFDATASPIRAATTVGANGQPLDSVDIPELQLWGDRSTNPNMDGLRMRAPAGTVRNLGMIGFRHGVEVGFGAGDTTSSATISDNAFGVDFANGGDPGASNRLDRGVVINGGVSSSVSGNVVAFTANSGVSIGSGASNFVVSSNFIEQTSLASVVNDGIIVSEDSSGSIDGNEITGSRAFAIDLFRNSGIVTITNNTLDGFGTAGSEEAGVRVFGVRSVVRDNVIQNGVGSGVVVVGEPSGNTEPSRPGLEIDIGGNVYGPLTAGANLPAAIDLASPASPEIGDGPTANDGAEPCGVSPGYGNRGPDTPTIAVERSGSNWIVTGTACADFRIDLYVGDNGTGLPTIPAAVTTANGAGIINATVPIANPAALAATHATASQTSPLFNTSEFGAPVLITQNQPPTLTNPGPQTATENLPFTLNPVGSDPDSAPLVWSATNMPAGMTINSGTGQLNWTPGETDGGAVLTITLSLSAGGDTVQETFTLTVIEDDQPPVVNPIPAGTATVGSTSTQPVSGSDPDTPPVTLTWSLVGVGPDPVPAGMTIDPTSGTVSYTPPVAGTFAVEVVASQPNSVSGSTVWSVTASDPIVVPTNSPPTVTPVPDQNVTLGDRVELTVAASDPDTPLVFTLLAGPPGMTIDGTGRLVWPDADPVGAQNVIVRVSDSGSPSLSTDVAFTITVSTPTVTRPTPTTTPPSTSTSTTVDTTTTTVDSTTTTVDSTTTTVDSTTTEPTSTTDGPTTTAPPVTTPTVPPPSDPVVTPPALPVDSGVVNTVVPQLRPPIEEPFEPTISVTSGIVGLLEAPGSIDIPPVTVGLAGAWIFILGVPLVLWERKRAVSVVAGIEAGEKLPVYATRNSSYPFAFLRADANMLWSSYRFMGLGEGLRVKVESPVGPVWVERKHLRPLHEPIASRHH